MTAPERLVPGGSVTLKDVALRAGVSQMTASAVLNGAGHSGRQIAAATRSRTLQAAAELGYRANGAAKAIATGRFGCVALLLSTKPHVSSLPQEVLRGIQDELAERRLHLTLFSLPDEDLTDEERTPKILREWMADGMIVEYTHRIPPRLAELIENHGLPAVWVNVKRERDCVRPDDLEVGRQQTRHLVELGHREIAYVHLYDSPEEQHYSALDRLCGYRMEMAAHGLRTIELVDASSAPGQRAGAIKQLLLSRRPTAIVGYSGRECEIALGAALRLGLDVPSDLSLVATGSAPSYALDCSLTVVELPQYEIGRRAARMLMRKIANPTAVQEAEVLPPRLVFSESSGQLAPARRKAEHA